MMRARGVLADLLGGRFVAVRLEEIRLVVPCDAYPQPTWDVCEWNCISWQFERNLRREQVEELVREACEVYVPIDVLLTERV